MSCSAARRAEKNRRLPGEDFSRFQSLLEGAWSWSRAGGSRRRVASHAYSVLAPPSQGLVLSSASGNLLSTTVAVARSAHQ